MAKKDKKKKDKQGSGPADAVEAVRAAVERTFHATSESAAGTQRRTQKLVDEVAHAAARVRETIEDLRLLDELKGLRTEVEALTRRVTALEAEKAKPAASRSTASRSRAASKPAAAKSRSTASRAKTSGTTRSSGSRAKSSGSTRSSGSRAKSSGTGSSSGSAS